MENTFKNGAIISRGALHEKTQYNVSNKKISACFNSSGAVTYYAEANKSQLIHSCYCNYYIDGEHIDIFSERTVTMIGRRQTTAIKTPAVVINSDLLLDDDKNGVFLRFWTENNSENSKISIAYCLDDSNDFKMLSNSNITHEHENKSFYFDIPNDKDGIKIFLTTKDFDESGFNASAEFDKAQQSAELELQNIKIPDGLDEMQKAMYLNCYFCALENYKEKGDYKGFMAGHHYLLPMRTYYRDSYFTVLAMYNGHTDKIKNQIVTLAKGISKDGHCPSAVKSDYTAWWGEHYDSPSFLSIMLYDYVKNTKDTDFLNQKIGDETVFSKAEAALLKLSAFEDETGLIYKDGVFNKRDWADEVNRYGYVTYDEILYARAWYSLSKLCELLNLERSAQYAEKFEKTKAAINDILWDDERGYYINFKNPDYTETNLSVDTVFAVIWDIADATRAARILENMENILECKNNKEVPCADFGVMTVYPFYKKATSAYFKSTEPLNYHNGANWPYWSAIYAHAKRKFNMEYRYALESWFTYNCDKNNFTPIEYFSPTCPDGSLLQAWSSAAAFVLDEDLSLTFWD